jgi:hypothetical protein
MARIKYYSGVAMPMRPSNETTVHQRSGGGSVSDMQAHQNRTSDNIEVQYSPGWQNLPQSTAYKLAISGAGDTVRDLWEENSLLDQWCSQASSDKQQSRWRSTSQIP